MTTTARKPPHRPKPNGDRPPPPAGSAASSAEIESMFPGLTDLPERLPKEGIPAIVHRSKLLADPRNPRTIDPYAAGALKESIRRTGGLVERPVWNRRTGYLVAGHQRLTQEDKRRGTGDYSLIVIVVDWDDAFALEQNVAFNNPNLQGQYDIELLDGLLRSPDFDFVNAGFDAVSLEQLYLQNNRTFDFPGLSEPDPGRREAEDAADDIADQLDEADSAKATEKNRRSDRDESAASRNSPEAIKQRRQEYREQSAYEGQTDTHLTLVFPTEEIKQAFMRIIQLPERQERADGVGVCRFLGLDIPELPQVPESNVEPRNRPAAVCSEFI